MSVTVESLVAELLLSYVIAVMSLLGGLGDDAGTVPVGASADGIVDLPI